MNDFLQSLRGGQKDKRVPKTRRNYDSGHYNQPPHYHHSQQPFQSPRAGNLKRGTRQQQVLPQDQPSQIMNLEAMDTLTSLLEAFVKNQEMLVDIEERKALAEERKADALEEIAESLRYLDFSQSPRVDDRLAVKPMEDEPEEEPFFDREEADQEPLFTQPSPQAYSDEPPAAAQPDETEVKTETVDPGSRRKTVKVIKRSKKDNRRTVTHVAEEKNDTGGPLSRDEVMETIQSMREKGATFDQVAKHFVDIGQPTFSGRGEWHAQTVHRLCNKRR